MELKRKLTTILVTDVVGFSRLISDDEEATLRRLEVFRSLWQKHAELHDGRIFNSAGDAVLIEFTSPVEALRCAIEFQEQAAEENRALVDRRQMHFRVGISIGDVVERGSDLLGDGVNVAARLQGLATPGGICVTSWVREAVSNKLGTGFRDLGDQSVKNIPTPIRVYAVVGPYELRDESASRSGLKRDWLGRITTSWRAMAAAAGLLLVGAAAAGVLAMRARSPQSTAEAPRRPVVPVAGSPGDLVIPERPAAPPLRSEPVLPKAEPPPAKPAVTVPLPMPVPSIPKAWTTPPAPEVLPAKPAESAPSPGSSLPKVATAPPAPQPAPAKPALPMPPPVLVPSVPKSSTTLPPKAEPTVEREPKPERSAAATPVPAAAPATLPPARPQPAPLTQQQQRDLRPKDTFRECTDCPEMVVLPRGEFLIGTSDAEIAALRKQHPEAGEVFAREGQQTRIRIAYGLSVGRTQITRGEFQAFVQATGYRAAAGCATHTQRDWKVNPETSWLAPGFPQEPSHPVVCVSWHDAVAYTVWLSQATGATYRLLSEAEAEYAIRGTTVATAQTAYFFGSDARQLCEHGNVGDLTGADTLRFWDRPLVAPCRDGFVYTAPAGSYKANAFGLHDVHGNAWTWTLDCENASHRGNTGDGQARTGGDCSRRIIRGGAWQDVAVLQRSASRYEQDAQTRDDNTGLRVARVIAP